MKPIKILLTLSLIIALSCAENHKNNQETIIQEQKGSVSKEKAENQLTYDNQEIAKYAIAAIMNQNPDIIQVKNDEDNFIVAYNRQNDGKKFEYKVKFSGRVVIWGNLDGRWRTSPYDEDILYEINDGALVIKQKFSDGSVITKEFSKTQN